MVIGGVGSLPFREFAMINGQIVDGAEARKGSEAPSLDDQFQEVIVAKGPVGPVPELKHPEVDMSGFGRMDLSAMQAPEGYESMEDYLDAKIEEFHTNALRTSGLTMETDKIRLNATDAYDFLMEDQSEGLDPKAWYAKKTDYWAELVHVQHASNRAARGKDVEPEKLMVTIGDKKYNISEIDALTRGLLAANAGWENAEAASRKMATEAARAGHERATMNWMIPTPEGFSLLSVKRALSEANVDKPLADQIFQRYLDKTCEKHESASELIRKMASIDMSSDASFRKGFGEFADWFAKGIERELAPFQGWYKDPKGIANKYKAALFYAKDCYGL